MLAAGLIQAEVARRLGVSRQSVMRWSRTYAAGGIKALTLTRRIGRPPRFNRDHQIMVLRILGTKPGKLGFDSLTWTPTLIRIAVARALKVQLSRTSVWRLLRQLGWTKAWNTALWK